MILSVASHQNAADRTVRVRGVFLALALCCVIAGQPACGAKRFAEVRESIARSGVYLDGVPFFRQGDSDCGPVALAGVLAYYGRPADIGALTRSLVTPALRGTLTFDLERQAGAAGLKARSRSGTVDGVVDALRQRTPVIALLDFGFGPLKQPHYVTVIGYDAEHRLFVMHDGATPNRLMTIGAFDAAWARAGRWMLIAAP